MTEPMAVCSCGACRTLMGHTGPYWVCGAMPEVDPKFCPECGDHLLCDGQREPWTFGADIIGGIRRSLEWLREIGLFWSVDEHGLMDVARGKVQPKDEWLTDLANATGTPVEHLAGEAAEGSGSL